MKRKIIYSCLILFSIKVSFAQSSKKELKRFRISDIQFYRAELFQKQLELNTNDFKSLIPKSTLVNTDFNGYTISSYPHVYDSYAPFIHTSSVMVGIQIRNKDKTVIKKNPILKLGLNLTEFSGRTLFVRHDDYAPYDTLKSSTTGSWFLFDSVKTKNYRMDYGYNKLQFDGSIIFRTNAQSILSIYSGVGLSIGASIDVHSNIWYTESFSTTAFYSQWDSTYWGPEDHKENKMNFNGSVYIPLGIDIHLFTRSKILRGLHVFYEYRFAENFISIPELRTLTYSSYQHGLGIKYSF